MEIGYQEFGTIKRTVYRPVWRGAVLGLVDLQALPPVAWCERCGAEVWREGERLCRRCRSDGRSSIDNGRSFYG